MNLMTKYGQTYGFSASDHVRVLEQYIGKTLHAILVNDAPFTKTMLKKYEKMKEYPVVDDLPKKAYYSVIRTPLIGKQRIEKSEADTLVRSLIRHDSDKLARKLIGLL